MAELARPAGIKEAALYKKDNSELKERAALWLDAFKKKGTVGRMRVRKPYQQQAANWSKKYEALQNRHIFTELQFQQLQAEHEKLRRDYDALIEQIGIGAAGKITFSPYTKRLLARHWHLEPRKRLKKLARFDMKHSQPID